jgi:hypothetical protein
VSGFWLPRRHAAERAGIDRRSFLAAGAGTLAAAALG